MRQGRQETTPLVHDGMMFLVEPCDSVEALDVRDGSRIWEYRRDQVEHPANLACVNRNGALYDDKLFIATHDAPSGRLERADRRRRVGRGGR